MFLPFSIAPHPDTVIRDAISGGDRPIGGRHIGLMKSKIFMYVVIKEYLEVFVT